MSLLVLEKLTFLLLIIQPCWLATLGDILCQAKGKDLFIHQNYKTGETLCCVSITCERGQEPVLCDKDDPWSTTCRSCPDGTYQSEARDSVDMLHCTAKTQCHGNLIARHEKSKIRDTTCICDPKRGVCNRAGVTRNPKSCIKKTCPQGFRLLSNCSCEVCIEPKNKSRLEQPPCDKRNLLCRNKRETATSETHISTVCPEGEESSSSVASVQTRADNIEKPEWISLSSVLPYLTSLVDNRPSNEDRRGHEDVTNDVVSVSQVKTSISWWFIVFITVIFVGITVAVIIYVTLARRRGYFCKSNPTSSSDIKKTVLRESSSSGDTEMDVDTMDAVDARDAPSVPLMPSNSSRFSEAASANGVMKVSDIEKLNALRPLLVPRLVVGESLWSVLQSNGTVTLEMKQKIKSATSDLDKAGELITYLSKGNSHAFKTFVAALIYTKQEHLARELDRDLTMEIKENYEEDQLPNFVLSLV